MRCLRLALSFIILTTCVYSATSPSATDKPSTPTQVTLRPTRPEKQPLVGKGEHHLTKEESASSQQQPSPSLLIQSIKHALIAFMLIEVIEWIFLVVIFVSTGSSKVRPVLFEGNITFIARMEDITEKVNSQGDKFEGIIAGLIIYVLIHTLLSYRWLNCLEVPTPTKKITDHKQASKKHLPYLILLRGVISGLITFIINKCLGNENIKQYVAVLFSKPMAHILVIYLIFVVFPLKQALGRDKQPPRSQRVLASSANSRINSSLDHRPSIFKQGVLPATSPKKQPLPNLFTHSIKHALIACIISLIVSLFLMVVIPTLIHRKAIQSILTSKYSFKMMLDEWFYYIKKGEEANFFLNVICGGVAYLLLHTFLLYRGFEYLDQSAARAKILHKKKGSKRYISLRTFIGSLVSSIVTFILFVVLDKTMVNIAIIIGSSICITYLLLAKKPATGRKKLPHKRPPHSTTKPKIASAPS